MASRTFTFLRRRPLPSTATTFLPCCYRPTHLYLVYFSTSSNNDNKDPIDAPSSLPKETIEATSTSLGQVIFLNSSKSGNVILGSLAIADPTLASLAAIGATTSNSTARLLGLDAEAWKNGLHGYNGALIGCASSVFASSLFPYAILGTLAGAVATPLVSASLNNVTSVPQWTWSFNIVMMSSLLRSRPLLESGESAAVEHSTKFMDVMSAPFSGISQIFVVNSHLSGLGILAATSLYSPGLALHALGGSVTGCIVGLVLGADTSDVAAGLWGYNSALTSMAIGTFYVDSLKTRVLSCTAAAGTAVLFGGMGTVFGAYGVPCLTLPFCTVATASYLLEGQIPGLKLSKAPHSPEKNV